jgi:pimeloyl-ACP methyl ester carboxylesterase
MMLVRVSLLLALVCLFPVTASAKSLCDKGDELSAIRGNGLCLAIKTFNADFKRDFQPTLVVMLHGDLAKGGKALYHIQRMREVARDDRYVAVAIIRPGYIGDRNRKSDGSNHGRRDSYTKRYNLAVGEIIQKLKKLHNAGRVIVVGHSGGAAMTAVIVTMFPDVADKAILVSCPCNIPRWTKVRRWRSWKRSMSPISFVDKVPSGTEVVAITGKKDRNTFPGLATEYVSRLKKRDINARLIIVDNAAHDLDDMLWYPTSKEIWE